MDETRGNEKIRRFRRGTRLIFENFFAFAGQVFMLARMCFLRWYVAMVCWLVGVAAVRAGERVVGYVPNWHDLRAFAETIDYTKVTHLNVAFENPVNDEGELSFNDADAVLVAEAKEKGVPVLVSIGGGGVAGNKTLLARYAGLLTDGRRASFVAKLAGYVSAHGFAGLDVDLEGPGILPGYGAFITDLAGALKPRGKLLTAALARDNGGEKVPDAALGSFDWVNIMAYDATGPWRPQTPGQHSSFEFAQESVRYWLGRGLAREKAVLGVPFYGYGFDKAFRGGRDYSYRELLEQFPGADQRDQVGETIWYNGQPTIRAKAAYVREQGLGGVMIWPLDADVSGPRSLLGAIHDALHSRDAASPSEHRSPK